MSEFKPKQSFRNEEKNNNNNFCVFCRGQHFSSKCKNVTSISARYDILRRGNKCFVCFKESHRVKDCPLNYNCFNCNRRHNIALCDGRVSDNKRDVRQQRQSYNAIAHTEFPDSSEAVIKYGEGSADDDAVFTCNNVDTDNCDVYVNLIFPIF